MTAYVALLRAVNVGGSGKLPMAEFKALCETAGFQAVKTYIASGNVVFRSNQAEKTVKSALEERLEAYAGKPVGVVVRTAAEMERVFAGNPFPDKAANKTVALFLDTAPTQGAIDAVTGKGREALRLGVREIYVHYPDGIGRSKLNIPAARTGTARNMNTVAKLCEMMASLSS